MAGLRLLFFKDLRIKALALVMAFAVYVHVFSAQDREMTYLVPIVVAPLPGGLMLANTPPKEARVRVHASGKNLLKLRTRGFRAEVRLESPRTGVLQRPLLGSDFQMPRGVKALSVEVIDPPVLNLQIEPAASADLPVAARMSGAVSADRALVRKPVPTPRTVRVIGPRSMLASLDSVLTMPVSAEGLRGDFEQEVQLDLPANVVAEPKTVRLRIELEERLARRTPLLAVEVTLPRWTQLIAVDPDSGSAEIVGAVSRVGQVQLVDTRLVAEIRHRVPRVQKVLLRAILEGAPADAPILVRCDPESVQVILR